MPIHRWSQTDPNLYHHFHQQWVCRLCDSLNDGFLPQHYSALLERSTPQATDDVASTLAARANRIAIRHRLGDVVSLIEIVSPGNKSSKAAMRQFVDKAVEFLEAGVHLLIIDLFPPTARDPFGIHRVIWEELYEEDPFVYPTHQPLTLASYMAGTIDRSPQAFVEPIGYGEALPDMPAYLDTRNYIPVPLEKTYQHSWDVCPADFKEAVESVNS